MVPSVLLFLGLALTVGATYYPCIPCRGEACDIEPTGCEYGTVRLCGRKVCGKGPGQRCGGYHSMFGKCGDGLACDGCGYCMGCAVSVTDGVLKCSHSDGSRCFGR